MANKGILDKVRYLLLTAKNNNCSGETLEKIREYTNQHTDDYVLGRVFGYSVSDYAFATLKWLNTRESLNIFDDLIHQISEPRKREIEELVSKKLYLEM